MGLLKVKTYNNFYSNTILFAKRIQLFVIFYRKRFHEMVHLEFVVLNLDKIETKNLVKTLFLF